MEITKHTKGWLVLCTTLALGYTPMNASESPNELANYNPWRIGKYATIVAALGTAGYITYRYLTHDTRKKERSYCPPSKTLSVEEQQAHNRQYVLSVLNSLAPALVKEILREDPDLTGHLRLLEDAPNNAAIQASVEPSKNDGLPIISVNDCFLKSCDRHQRAALAHEIGHYALQCHPYRPPQIMNWSSYGSSRNFEIKGAKKTTERRGNQLDWREILQKLKTQLKEYDADRFAVITMKIPPADMIEIFLPPILPLEHANFDKKSRPFRESHPRYGSRISHIKDKVQRELEISRRQTPDINWQELRDGYLELFTTKSQTPRTLEWEKLTQEKINETKGRAALWERIESGKWKYSGKEPWGDNTK